MMIDDDDDNYDDDDGDHGPCSKYSGTHSR